MCKESATAGDVRAAMPHPVVGSAADPIALEPVDDALLTSDDTITRAPLAAGTAQAPQFEPGRSNVGLIAEHGFSALVTVRRGDTTTSVLFDTGLSPDAMLTNADRLGLDLSGVHAVVLSHGHFDHVGGLAGLAGRRGTRSLPMVVHPLVWTRRRLAGGSARRWPGCWHRGACGSSSTTAVATSRRMRWWRRSGQPAAGRWPCRLMCATGSAVLAMVEQVRAAMGEVKVLVHNALIPYAIKSFDEVSWDELIPWSAGLLQTRLRLSSG